MLRNLFFLLIILLIASCAKNPTEEMQEAIDIALTHLSNGECEEAITVLEDVADQDTNPVYVQVLASAHACKSGFNEISFVANDLAAINTTSNATVFKSISILSLSTETEADSENFTNILTGINTILNSTDGDPGQETRSTVFGPRKAGDMGVQTVILNLVNLGKFLNYYGNVNASGLKGAGIPAANKCFINYNDPRATALTGVSTGACISDSDGHVDLDQTTEDGKRRICEGLMLITNTMDILENLDLSGASTLSKLATVSTMIATIKIQITAQGLGTLINMTSQSTCETHLDTANNLLDMEYLYALLFESGLQ
jgi:hypothetical protein